jgi:hypothetical protein
MTWNNRALSHAGEDQPSLAVNIVPDRRSPTSHGARAPAQDALTAGITTAIVFKVAAFTRHNARQQPILRRVHAVAGTSVALGTAWEALRPVAEAGRP